VQQLSLQSNGGIAQALFHSAIHRQDAKLGAFPENVAEVLQIASCKYNTG